MLQKITYKHIKKKHDLSEFNNTSYSKLSGKEGRISDASENV